MYVRDLERIIATREPVTLGGEVYRVERCVIDFVNGCISYTIFVRDRKGRQFKTSLSDLCYLDGRTSI